MSPAIQDSGKRVLIEGFTNLPDAALVTYEVEHQRFGHGRGEAFQKSLNWSQKGNIPVKNGRFVQALDVSDWPTGEINVWVAFQTILGTKTAQPPAIIARYGEMGERIEGSQVTTTGAMRRVEAKDYVVKR